MTINILDEVIKSLLQLFVLGVLGGGISWFYSKLQKKRELKTQVLRDFAKLHGRFIALRFEFNSFHIQWKGQRSAEFHPLTDDEIRIEKWKYFQEACSLIGDFYGLKPLMVENFPECKADIEFLHSKYQDWRRNIGGNQPVFQQKDGKSEEVYHELRDTYNRVIKQMRRKV